MLPLEGATRCVQLPIAEYGRGTESVNASAVPKSGELNQIGGQAVIKPYCWLGLGAWSEFAERSRE